jgi:hypothetical protein
MSIFALSNLQQICSCVLGSYLSMFKIDELDKKDKLEEITKEHLQS